MPLSELSYGEFLLFLYLTVANADNDIGFEEIEVLFSKIDADFFEHNGSELLVSIVFKKYHSLTCDERVEAIRNVASKHLKGNDRGLTILQNMYQIIKADGIVNPAEKELFERIENIINDVNLV